MTVEPVAIEHLDLNAVSAESRQEVTRVGPLEQTTPCIVVGSIAV
jgi:hypothetical protein